MAEMVHLYNSGNSIPEIAKVLDLPLSTVRSRLVSLGARLRTRQEGLKIAAGKGKLSHSKGKKRPHTEDRKQRISESMRRWGQQFGKGFRITPNGYAEFTRGPNKGRSVHVVLMENLMGRALKKFEVVHHIDENKLNNSIENLCLMKREDHTRLHRIGGQRGQS